MNEDDINIRFLIIAALIAVVIFTCMLENALLRSQIHWLTSEVDTLRIRHNPEE